MAWRAIIEADIQTGITGVELTSARTVVLAAGQVDPLTECIQVAVDMIRGYIAGSQNNHLGPEGTVPDKLVATAIDIVVYRLCKRIPKKILLTDERRDAYEDAIKLLKDVAADKFRLEVPDTFTTEEIGIPAPSISVPTPFNRPPHRRFGRFEEGGI